MRALFGGTFDPIHLGHVHLANEVLAHFPLRELTFVPAGQNPHKHKAPWASANARLEMLKRSLREVGEPRFSVLDWECLSPPPSYTLFTIERLLKDSDEPLVLVMGNEVFRSLPQWYQATRICHLVDLVVVTRDPNLPFEPNFFLKKASISDGVVDEQSARISHSGGTRWIEFLALSALPYQATRLRKLITQQWKTSNMEHPPQGIQRSVWQFIKENHLYSVTREEG